MTRITRMKGDSINSGDRLLSSEFRGDARQFLVQPSGTKEITA